VKLCRRQHGYSEGKTEGVPRFKGDPLKNGVAISEDNMARARGKLKGCLELRATQKKKGLPSVFSFMVKFRSLNLFSEDEKNLKFCDLRKFWPFFEIKTD